MGKLRLTLPEDLMKKLNEYDAQYESIVQEMLEEGIKPLASAATANFKAVVSNEATGKTMAALGISPVKHGNGAPYDFDIKFGFGDAKDARGQPNALKGIVLEYGRENGTSHQPARPWLKPAVRASRQACLKAMEEVCQKRLENL